MDDLILDIAGCLQAPTGHDLQRLRQHIAQAGFDPLWPLGPTVEWKGYGEHLAQ